MVQLLKLPVSYGGEEYAMLSDLLVFSRPDEVRDNIHLEYLKRAPIFSRPTPLVPVHFTKFD